MKKIVAEFTKSQVRKAGEILRSPRALNPDDFKNRSKALDVLSNWRSAHLVPMNTFQTTLRTKSKEVEVKQRCNRSRAAKAIKGSIIAVY